MLMGTIVDFKIWILSWAPHGIFWSTWKDQRADRVRIMGGHSQGHQGGVSGQPWSDTVDRWKHTKINGHLEGSAVPYRSSQGRKCYWDVGVASPVPDLPHRGHRWWPSGNLSHRCLVHLAGRGLTISLVVCDLERQRAHGSPAFSLPWNQSSCGRGMWKHVSYILIVIQ